MSNGVIMKEIPDFISVCLNFLAVQLWVEDPIEIMLPTSSS